VDAAVERCGLGDEDRRVIGNLSRGYRQRVGLAQAIIHDPPILILDEPTAGLDPQQIIEIRELIRSLSGDHTVILSTHILSEVTVTCSKVAIISYGEIVQQGSLEGLASAGEDHLQIRIRVSREGEGVQAALTQLPWTKTVRPAGDGTYFLEVSREDRAREEIAALAVQRGWGLIEMTPLTRSLEEIYLEATRRLPGSEGAGGPTTGFPEEGLPRDSAGKAAAVVAGAGRS
jgi:ABC-2 type transport system ATP-binding protein